MTDNLFDDNNNDDKTAFDPNKNYLEELVGEGKKFRTVEDLAKGKVQSDLFIPHLQRELDELRSDYQKVRDEYNSGPKLKELIDQLALQQQSSSEQHQNANDNKEKPIYDPKEFENLISSKLQEHETSKKHQENFNSVMVKLKEKFGDNYQTILKDQIENLGLTPDFVNDLARKHPAVLFKTLGIDTKTDRNDFNAPPKSSLRNDNFAPRTDKRSWSFYQKMRKENPSLYHQPKTQVQMHQDAITLGKDFEDGDYNS